ncbi:MAG: hypothetical protein WCT04_12410 [Planctomycetota bacterium]
MINIDHLSSELTASILTESCSEPTHDAYLSTSKSQPRTALENPLSDFKKRLQALGQLRLNWNSYDAEPPNQIAVGTATLVLELASTIGVVPTRVDPSAENGIVLSFVNGNRYSDIECFNSGDVCGAMHDRAQEPVVWNIGSEPIDLRAALKTIRGFIHG